MKLRGLCADQRGGGPTVEWLFALVLVLGFALLIGAVGRGAGHRLAGDAPADAVGVASTGDTSHAGPYASINPTNALGPAPDATTPTAASSATPQESDRDVYPECRDGFANGALHAFVNGEGELVGDMFGVRDRDIVDWVWNRPTSQVISDLQRAAPGIVAAAPGVLASAGNAAIASVRNDPMLAADAALDALFIDSLRTTGQLAMDGWHGGGVLIAAAQSGDCVAFGRTVRSGVNNAPELALSAGDAIGLLGSGAALGATAVRSKRVGALAKRADAKTIARLLGKEAVLSATQSIDNVTRAAGRPNVRALASSVTATAKTAASAGTMGAAWSSRAVLDEARRFVTQAGTATGNVARSIARGDLAGAMRAAMNTRNAAITALSTVTAATRAGVASIGHAADRFGTEVRTQFAVLAHGSLPETRTLAAANQHVVAAAPVCVGRKCPRGSGLCFTAGTRVHTPKGRVAIETLRVGERVQTTGTELSNDGSEVDTRWKTVSLEMERGPGDVVDIELLRSPEWITQTGAIAGRNIALTLPEMKLTGRARVIAVNAARRVARGPGQIVLATFASKAKDVLELRFTNTNEVLEPTSQHRLYSLDRSDWIAAGKLRVGERLRTRAGEATLASVQHKPGVHRVYNLQVDTDHNYFVGDLGVLSHNQDPYEPDEEARLFEAVLRRKRWPTLFPEPPIAGGVYKLDSAREQDALRMLAVDGGYDAFLDMFEMRTAELDEAVYKARDAFLRTHLGPQGTDPYARDALRIRQLRDATSHSGVPPPDEVVAGIQSRIALKDQIDFLHGEVLWKRLSAGWEPANTIDLRELCLWEAHGYTNGPLMEWLLTQPEGQAFQQVVLEARNVRRAAALIVYAERAPMLNDTIFRRIEELAGGTSITRSNAAVAEAQERLTTIFESELSVTFLLAEKVEPREAYEVAVREAVQWNRPPGAPSEALGVERNFMYEMAQLGDVHASISLNPNFLHSMQSKGRRLIVDASAGSDPEQPWILELSDEGREAILRQYDRTDVAHQRIAGASGETESRGVLLDNLLTTAGSARAFMRFIIDFANTP